MDGEVLFQLPPAVSFNSVSGNTVTIRYGILKQGLGAVVWGCRVSRHPYNGFKSSFADHQLKVVAIVIPFVSHLQQGSGISPPPL
jgi:hypothetical protein